MKRFIAAVAVIAFAASSPFTSHAQLTPKVPIANADTLLTNADTAYVALSFDGSFKSVEAWVEEVSGTTGGKVVLQGKLPHNGVSVGTDWAGIDSLALADQATAQFKLFNVPNPRTYAAYRLVFLKSGAGTARIKAWYVRYTGGSLFYHDPYQGMATLNTPSVKTDEVFPSITWTTPAPLSILSVSYSPAVFAMP